MSLPSLNNVGGLGSSGSGAGSRDGGWELVVVRRVAVGTGVAVDATSVGATTVTVGSNVGIGTTVAKVIELGDGDGGGGVGCGKHADTSNSAKKISQRFMQ
jgi:hypothetical protein